VLTTSILPACTVWSQCTPVPDGRTDRRTDEHHGNRATIRSNERIVRWNLQLFGRWIMHDELMTVVERSSCWFLVLWIYGC